MKRKPERCPRCAADCGWDLTDPGDPQICDHGRLAAAVANAELRDRIVAARLARATGTGEPT
jgi:hypothetical protein